MPLNRWKVTWNYVYSPFKITFFPCINSQISEVKNGKYRRRQYMIIYLSIYREEERLGAEADDLEMKVVDREWEEQL